MPGSILALENLDCISVSAFRQIQSRCADGEDWKEGGERKRGLGLVVVTLIEVISTIRLRGELCLRFPFAQLARLTTDTVHHLWHRPGMRPASYFTVAYCDFCTRLLVQWYQCRMLEVPLLGYSSSVHYLY